MRYLLAIALLLWLPPSFAGDPPIPLESALLMWHARLGKWVLGQSESAKYAATAGDCSGDGPHVIDFEARVIWTCEWGP